MSNYRLMCILMSIYIRRNKVYASWRLTSISVNRGSHFQVHFVWQVWDGQLSPSSKSIRSEAFGGWKVDRGTTQLHARILRGKGVQKKNWNKITVRSLTSATFVLPGTKFMLLGSLTQNIHLGQPRITCPSPFRVADVGRSIITLF